MQTEQTAAGQASSFILEPVISVPCGFLAGPWETTNLSSLESRSPLADNTVTCILMRLFFG